MKRRWCNYKCLEPFECNLKIFESLARQLVSLLRDSYCEVLSALRNYLGGIAQEGYKDAPGGDLKFNTAPFGDVNPRRDRNCKESG
jgi:hypothetical protein